MRQITLIYCDCVKRTYLIDNINLAFDFARRWQAKHFECTLEGQYEVTI